MANVAQHEASAVHGGMGSAASPASSLQNAPVAPPLDPVSPLAPLVASAGRVEPRLAIGGPRGGAEPEQSKLANEARTAMIRSQTTPSMIEGHCIDHAIDRLGLKAAPALAMLGLR